MAWRDQIEEIVNRETRAWDNQDVELLLSVFHPDMVWPWPPTADSHDPEDWVIAMGRFDRTRWGGFVAEVVCYSPVDSQPQKNPPN